MILSNSPFLVDNFLHTFCMFFGNYITLKIPFSGHIPIDAALDLTKYLNQEVDFLVWKSVEKSLTKLGNLLRSGSDKTGQLFNVRKNSKV